MSINLFEVEKVKEEENGCKGLFWRANVSSFLSSHNSIEVRKSLRLLKRKSCSDCSSCAWIWEYFNEDVNIEPHDYLGKIENGKIYTFKVHTSKGFEDLYPEVDYIEFVEVKE